MDSRAFWPYLITKLFSLTGSLFLPYNYPADSLYPTDKEKEVAGKANGNIYDFGIRRNEFEPINFAPTLTRYPCVVWEW